MTLPILRHARAVLLDFDGPVCSIFAGYPAGQVADELRRHLAAVGVAVTPEIEATVDPLVVLRLTADLGPHLVPQLDDELTHAEVMAAHTATATPGSLEFLEHCHRADVPVVIVSNNSELGVRTYLTEHQQLALIHHVFGRPRHRPRLMKPHSAAVDAALTQLALNADQVVLIGDSVSDIEVARRCSIPSIALANRPEKVEPLTRAGADVVIRHMTDLLADVPPSTRSS
jgi:phosphoglycolate phosphatase-like HAD superfamily hydrolase